MPWKEFGERLNADRKRGGLTQEQLADRLSEVLGAEISQQSINQWCRGQYRPVDRRTLLALCHSLYHAGGIGSLAEVNKLLASVEQGAIHAAEAETWFPRLHSDEAPKHTFLSGRSPFAPSACCSGSLLCAEAYRQEERGEETVKATQRCACEGEATWDSGACRHRPGVGYAMPWRGLCCVILLFGLLGLVGLTGRGPVMDHVTILAVEPRMGPSIRGPSLVSTPSPPHAASSHEVSRAVVAFDRRDKEWMSGPILLVAFVLGLLTGLLTVSSIMESSAGLTAFRKAGSQGETTPVEIKIEVRRGV